MQKFRMSHIDVKARYDTGFITEFRVWGVGKTEKGSIRALTTKLNKEFTRLKELGLVDWNLAPEIIQYDCYKASKGVQGDVDGYCFPLPFDAIEHNLKTFTMIMIEQPKEEKE